MSKTPKAFLLYLDKREYINELSNEEAGIFIKNVYNAVGNAIEGTNEEILKEEPATSILVREALKSIRKDLEKYQETSLKRSEAGKKGMQSRYSQKSEKPTKERKNFKPPTKEEVESFCLEQKYNISADDFINYYAARGWELSKGRKVKDWKACVRTWVKNSEKWNICDISQKNKKVVLHDKQTKFYTDDI